MRIHYIKRAALSLCAAMSLGLSATSQVSQSVTTAQNAQAEPLTPPYSETFADESFLESYTIIDSKKLLKSCSVRIKHPKLWSTPL